MSDDLNLCEKCGDAYTLGRLCTSCAQQEQIDNEHYAGGYDMWEENNLEPYLECPECGSTDLVWQGGDNIVNVSGALMSRVDFYRCAHCNHVVRGG